ncbi:hypothetical protein JOF56_006457 [Kibdelosporangium banguiense]|uniref:Secreted protein n=1 Tax=Kibdelosporangium banguiense TaxID=1365924 RepID=A0ABS4TNT4_9PSEU|nr:hypothetical protein [Kibdelosporangium banguiense]MBP2326072.1 hypothetical protein [Kibdelosporangium banguiense]
MRLRMVLVALMAFVVPGFFAVPASATAQAPVGVQFVGVLSEANKATSLYQCPNWNCNKGSAVPGQPLSAICYWPADSQWNWVLNQSNGHTGYARSSDLTKQAPVSCASYGRGVRVKGSEAFLYQCPATSCNRGIAYAADDITTVCYWGDTKKSMNLVHNHANGHVGFALAGDLTDQSDTTCRAN